MTPEEFKKEYHWLSGIEEYYLYDDPDALGQKFEIIYKALMQDNWYRKRDVIVDLMLKEVKSSEVHNRAWLNVLLHEKLDVTLKPQLVATLLRKYMAEDPFLVSICKFIDYWAVDGEAAEMPDMNDFLSRGQVKSKVWMIAELKNVFDGSLGNIAFYGGWYNFLAHMIFAQLEVNKIYSIDIDESVEAPSKRLVSHQVKAGTFLPVTTNVNKIKWDDGVMLTHSAELEQKHTDAQKILPQDVYDNSFIDRGQIQVVINTSCEHMDNTWFDNLPEGQAVVLQTNDYFDNDQHVNCCKDLEEVKNKYKFSTILYEGSLDTALYERYMLIGIK